MSIPDPPDTPKETPMAHGRYVHMNDRALWEHVADKVIAVEKRQDEQTGVLVRHDAAIAELVPLVRASVTMPRALQAVVAAAAVACAMSLIVLAFAAVTLVRTPTASASTQTSETAHR